MPAKGHLAKIAVKKYGPRKDDRPKVLAEVLASVKGLVADAALLLSDRCSSLPCSGLFAATPGNSSNR